MLINTFTTWCIAPRLCGGLRTGAVYVSFGILVKTLVKEYRSEISFAHLPCSFDCCKDSHRITGLSMSITSTYASAAPCRQSTTHCLSRLPRHDQLFRARFETSWSSRDSASLVHHYSGPPVTATCYRFQWYIISDLEPQAQVQNSISG